MCTYIYDVYQKSLENLLVSVLHYKITNCPQKRPDYFRRVVYTKNVQLRHVKKSKLYEFKSGCNRRLITKYPVFLIDKHVFISNKPYLFYFNKVYYCLLTLLK